MCLLAIKIKHTGLHKKYEDFCIFQHLHFLKLLTYFMNSTYSHTLSKLNVFSSLWVHAKRFCCFTFAFWESMIYFLTNKLYPNSSWTKENIKTKKDSLRTAQSFNLQSILKAQLITYRDYEDLCIFHVVSQRE